MVRCRHGIFLIWQDCKYLGHFLVRHKLHPIARNTGNTSIETKSTSNEERLEKTIHGRKDIARRKERRQSRRRKEDKAEEIQTDQAEHIHI